MFRLLIIAGWVFFAINAIFLIAMIVSRDMGDDAAGRGLARGLGLIGLAIVLAAAVGLYSSSRAHSWAGAVASMVPLAIPALFLFGTDIEASIHRLKSRFEQRKIGRYHDPVQRELAKAIETEDFESMRRLLATHPNLNGRDDAGYDLLSYAVGMTRLARSDDENMRSVEGVRLLLEAGMDPNHSWDQYGGATFASTAYDLSDPVRAAVTRLMLDHGADPNATVEGQPIIFGAWENLDGMRMLLDRGADINAVDKSGDTPLLFYMWNGRWPAALFALESGARLDVKNNFGTTPELALEGGRQLAERMGKKLPDTYEHVKAALALRRQAEAHH